MMKRGLNEDYIRNWNQTQPPAQKLPRDKPMETNQRTAFIAPRTETLAVEQRISSLIPAKLRKRVAAGAQLTQRIAAKIWSAHWSFSLGSLAARLRVAAKVVLLA